LTRFGGRNPPCLASLWNSRRASSLIAFLGRLAYVGNRVTELTPAQWAGLCCFARANRSSRTVSGLADFHAITRGTASQTVNTLVKKGYLVRDRSPLDGRSLRSDLTDRACAALENDPLRDVAQALGRLPADTLRALAGALTRTLEDLTRVQGRREFGPCTLCDHLERGEIAEHRRCRHYDQVLDAAELELLCSNLTRTPPGTSVSV